MRSRLPFCLWLLALAGCAGPGKKTAQSEKPSPNPATATDHASDQTSDRFAVTLPHTPFYKYGPAQAQGADLSLRKGVVVTLIKRSSGFSRVRIPEGEEGYIANDRLAPAPPEPVVAPLLRVDNPRDAEWLKVVPLDQMLEEPALPVGTGENLLNRSNLSDSHGQNDHQ